MHQPEILEAMASKDIAMLLESIFVCQF
ncbi:hypothetical protein MTR67_035978 [Solanum verrucosum]|uniref:Uncharacterized protein n=1 Tax=Solanum verrucosum TaxID=315347 RepID=A0AAF0UAU8_SOLVR|nr:hypothetical protein MTR67_035978 [Solanum verrucosum]